MKNSATSEVINLLGTKLRSSSSEMARAIKSIAEVEHLGSKTYFVVIALGLEVVEDMEGRVIAAHFHSAGHEGYGGFPLQFHGVAFAHNREEVRTILGSVEASGVGATGPWDRYRYGQLGVTLLFHEDEQSIQMMTCSISDLDSQVPQPQP